MEQKQVSLYDETPQATSAMMENDMRLFAGIVFVGALVGLGVMGLSFVFREFIVKPWMCGSIDAFALCSNGGSIALNAATVVVGIVGTIILVRMSTYRPLLIAMAAAISLWGANAWLGAMSWYEMTSWLVVMYAAAYGIFAWILRIYNFPLAFALTIACVIAARVVLQL